MSEPEHQTDARTRIKPDQQKPPGTWMFWLGILFPMFVIGFEWFTGICAETFFDPLPTYAHIALALAACAINFWLWRSLCNSALRSSRSPWLPWLPFAGGVAIAIAGVYTLWFLPLLPFSVIAIMFFGIGLLPFGPVWGLIVAVRLTQRATAATTEPSRRRVVAGVLLGLAVTVLLDVPSAATYLAMRWTVEGGEAATRAVALMRAVGDRDTLQQRCYFGDRKAFGPLNWLTNDAPLPVVDRGPSFPRLQGATAQELYYRWTGKTCSAAAPSWVARRNGMFNEMPWDRDQGGTEVGGKLAGLALQASRIEGSIKPEEAAGSLDWTMEFTNASQVQREARLTLALPPGAVASRATLWVKGEPREASFAARAAVRAAYEKVVRRERRDPLLVTASGPDRLLVQAFPIEPGKSLKLRIGLSIPLSIASNGQPTLALPVIAERNFAIDTSLRHWVWIDSASDLTPSTPTIAAQRAANGAVQLRGSLTDDLLARERLRFVAPVIAKPRTVRVPWLARSQKEAPPELQGTVIQTVMREPVVAPARLMIVLDGSVDAGAAGGALQKAIESIPSQAVVGMILAGEVQTRIEPAPASMEHKQRLRQAVQSAKFRGGHNNVQALADALERLAGESNAALLWIHGPQPVAFADSEARLIQLIERSGSLPKLLLYQAPAGPNKILRDHPWFWNASTFSASSDAASDLREVLAALYSAEPRWRIRRTFSNDTPQTTDSGDAIVRLWAVGHVRELLARGPAKRDEALKLASRAHIVTSISGAVVLETDADYKANNLPEPGTPLPEPGIWSLLLISGLGLWFARRRRAVRRG